MIKYMSIQELLDIVPLKNKMLHEYTCMKYFTDYDVVIIMDGNETVIGIYTDDRDFANTIRYLRNNAEKYQNVFTQSIRCVIINYSEYYPKILIEEIKTRYSVEI